MGKSVGEVGGSWEVSRASVELTFPAMGTASLPHALYTLQGRQELSAHAVSAAHSLETRVRVSPGYPLLPLPTCTNSPEI